MIDRLLAWLDRLLIPICFFIALMAGLRSHPGWQVQRMIYSDGEGYYLYLPALFIHGDWKAYDGTDGIKQLTCCIEREDHQIVTRYTYGVALLEMPFFLGAHAYSSLFAGPGSPPPSDWHRKYDEEASLGMMERKYTELRGQATGFSDPYAYSLVIAAAFYMAAGLGLVRAALRRRFSNSAATATTILVFLATNLFYYATREGNMSHVYSFFLFTAALYLVPLWLQRPRWWLTAVLGACLGAITIIRPTNGMLMLLIPLWEVYSAADFKERVRRLAGEWLHLLVMAAVAALVVLPQLFFWKQMFGTWMAWSYGDEGFSRWSSPVIHKVLFSYQNGLFLYTPVMLLAMVGIGMGLRRRQVSAPVVLLIFLLATYTFASWWAWWFGGAFGHRCFVEFYALLAWPLALVVEWVLGHRSHWVRWAGMGLAFCFIYANLKMTAMYTPPWDGPDWNWGRYADVLRGVAKVTWWPGL